MFKQKMEVTVGYVWAVRLLPGYESFAMKIAVSTTMSPVPIHGHF